MMYSILAMLIFLITMIISFIWGAFAGIEQILKWMKEEKYITGYSIGRKGINFWKI